MSTTTPAIPGPRSGTQAGAHVFLDGDRIGLLRLATAGSVDDGKSTLVGRLLHDSKSILIDQLEAVERTSRDRGLEQTDLALLTDGLRAEREQGITIDVAYRYFATDRRTFILADTPGHVQYTRNMVTGASTADLAIVLVDARNGVVEQTRRHLAVAALLRVPNVLLAVNKIDLVGFDEARFTEVSTEFSALAAHMGVPDVVAVPVSALLGDNVVDRSENTPWYHGPTLLEHLEQVEVGGDVTTRPLRMPVQYVIRPQQEAWHDYRGYAGQIVSGRVRLGDAVTVLPSGHTTTIVGIDLHTQDLVEAAAPSSVTLRLADDLDVGRGDVIVAADAAPVPTRELVATVAWLSERPLRPGARVLVKHGTKQVKAIVGPLRSRLDITSLRREPAPAELRLNEIGEVTLRLASAVPAEDYGVDRRTGAFLVIDEHDGWTLAAGMVGSPQGWDG